MCTPALSVLRTDRMQVSTPYGGRRAENGGQREEWPVYQPVSKVVVACAWPVELEGLFCLLRMRNEPELKQNRVRVSTHTHTHT